MNRHKFTFILTCLICVTWLGFLLGAKQPKRTLKPSPLITCMSAVSAQGVQFSGTNSEVDFWWDFTCDGGTTGCSSAVVMSLYTYPEMELVVEDCVGFSSACGYTETNGCTFLGQIKALYGPGQYWATATWYNGNCVLLGTPLESQSGLIYVF